MYVFILETEGLVYWLIIHYLTAIILHKICSKFTQGFSRNDLKKNLIMVISI